MRNGKSLTGLLTLVLLTALTVFSCKTTEPVNLRETLDLIKPPVPEAPALEPVKFEDRDEGLWLSYDEYRSLERNIIALREYAARLEIIIGFYREE